MGNNFFYWPRQSNDSQKIYTENKQTDCHWHIFRLLMTDLVEAWYDNLYYWSLHFETSPSDFNLVKVAGVQERKNFCACYPTKFSIDLNEIRYAV